MSSQYYTKKYPELCPLAAKLISVMESECNRDGKIFDKLAEIIAEYPESVQNNCINILKVAMHSIWNGFRKKSLEQKNKIRENFQKDVEAKLFEMSEEAHLDRVLVTHMTCALSAVWKSIGRDLVTQNEHIKFYNSNLVKFSKKLTS